MRSYGQYCGLARALDTVGDRWSLLVVRELLEGPRRYAQLLDGLPGIATNLLVERLRSLEAAGVVERHPDGRYLLSAWGEGLHDVVYALGRWASPLMGRPQGDDAFRPHWLRHVVTALFEGVDERRGDAVIELRCGAQPMTLISSGGRVHLVGEAVARPDLVLAGPPDALVGLIAGGLSAREAKAHGVSVEGDARTLGRLRPLPRATTVER